MSKKRYLEQTSFFRKKLIPNGEKECYALWPNPIMPIELSSCYPFGPVVKEDFSVFFHKRHFNFTYLLLRITEEDDSFHRFIGKS